MCGCGCDIVADLVRAEAEARAAHAADPAGLRPAGELDRRQGFLARVGAWLLAPRPRGGSTLVLTRASCNDRIEAV